ncbi:MAG: peptide deformylase [Phycisphaerae bacterium]
MRHDRTTRETSPGKDTPSRKPLSLRLYPDSVLRQRCEPVDRFDEWLADVFEEMLALMRNHKGIGLAGPQAGLTKRLFVAEIAGQTLRLANPVIRAPRGRDRMDEGCLSLPGVQVEVGRSLQVEIHGYDAGGKKLKHTLRGLWARVVQHEIDHLDGVLISDYEQQQSGTNSEAREP